MAWWDEDKSHALHKSAMSLSTNSLFKKKGKSYAERKESRGHNKILSSQILPEMA